jgi:hypothetical protein
LPQHLRFLTASFYFWCHFAFWWWVVRLGCEAANNVYGLFLQQA